MKTPRCQIKEFNPEEFLRKDTKKKAGPAFRKGPKHSIVAAKRAAALGKFEAGLKSLRESRCGDAEAT